MENFDDFLKKSIRADSKEPAVDLNNKLVTEEDWSLILNEDIPEMINTFEFSRDSVDAKKYTDELLDLMTRIKGGERSQELWNTIMDLLG